MTQLVDPLVLAPGFEKMEGAHVASDEWPRRLCVYLVVDESSSLPAIGRLNHVLVEMHQLLVRHPAISEVVLASLIVFSTDAQVLVELSDLSEHDTIPLASANGSSNYARAFALLRRTISTDVAALKERGVAPLRPVVVFFSDGRPTDTGAWEPEHAALVDPAWPLHPNVIAFGIGAATASVIERVGNFAAYMEDQGATPAAALTHWVMTLLS